MVWRQEAKSGTVAGSRALGPVRPTSDATRAANAAQPFWVGLRARDFPTERVLSRTPLIIRTGWAERHWRHGLRHWSVARGLGPATVPLFAC